MVAESKSEPVRVGPLGLPGEWAQAATAQALVLCTHGGNGGNGGGDNMLGLFSAPKRRLSEVLHQHQLATLCVDLLGVGETQDAHGLFNIPQLTERLLGAMDWALARWSALPSPLCPALGLLSASTGAAAALQAAAARPGAVGALVLLGGRVDLAPDLAHVHAPTLLIVGGMDGEVQRLNRQAARLLRCRKRLEVVPGASQLLSEPSATDVVAQLAAHWFNAHLTRASM